MKGVLLINVGTPAAVSTPAIRRYLREFLSDPRVLDVSAPMRWLLLNFLILPFRPQKSRAAYAKIWSDQGSPLLTHSLAQASALERLLGMPVVLGMRYGQPSISSALAELERRGAQELVIVPLYPQYSSASTGSAIDAVFAALRGRTVMPAIRVVSPFYDHPGFLDAFTQVALPVLQANKPDHVLFSYHGLPERQVRAVDATGRHCLGAATCCDALGEANRHCYRAQAFATSRALAARLAPPSWSVSFQSRLGRVPWIRPYTDQVLQELATRGVRRLAVVCPSFVADCLETLEEIALRARDTWLSAGGESLVLVPSLNAHPRWIEALGELATAS